jgi:hypothetical protein
VACYRSVKSIETMITWTGDRLVCHVTSLYCAWPGKGFIDLGAIVTGI